MKIGEVEKGNIKKVKYIKSNEPFESYSMIIVGSLNTK